MIIYDYLRLFVIIKWLFMIISNFFMIIYDYLWLFMIIYDYLWLLMIICDYFIIIYYCSMYKCRSRLCLFVIIDNYLWLSVIYINNYLWLLWSLVIIKWLFVIIWLWHVSVVCINVVAGLLFCLFVIIDNYLCCSMYKCWYWATFFEKYLEKLIWLI